MSEFNTVFFDTDDAMQFFEDLSSLMDDELIEYDPFFSVPAFMTYDDGLPVGFATFVITDADPGMPKDNILCNTNRKEAELTLYVTPEYRRRGIATDLLAKVKEYIKNNSKDTTVIFSLPDELKASSLASNPAFSELVLMINPKKEDIELTDEIKKMDIKKKKDDDGFSYTLYLDGKDVARLSIYPDDELYDSMGLYRLFVNPEYRRRGLGTALTKYALNDVAKKNSTVILNVRDINIPAVNLYKKIGFKESEKVDYYN